MALITNTSTSPEAALTFEKMAKLMKDMRASVEENLLLAALAPAPIIPREMKIDYRPEPRNRSWQFDYPMSVKGYDHSVVAMYAGMADLVQPSAVKRPDPFGGCPVSTSLFFEESYEDWSCVRSPGRARRRLKRGFRQNILHLKRPMKQVFVIQGVLHMHPEIKRQIERECARTGGVYHVPTPGI